LENILNNILPQSCLKISFPTLHQNHLHFCFNTDSPENKNTITVDRPFGDFFHGIEDIRLLVKQLKEKYNNEQILQTTLETIDNPNFISNEQIIEHQNRSLEFLKVKALNSDIPNIYYFVLNNYKVKRLWHDPNHPNGILLNELCKQLFIKMELNYPQFDEIENIHILDELLNHWKMPILKQISNYYNMTDVDNKCSSKYHVDIFDEKTYISKYVSFLLLHNTNDI
jgi:hypothetical protein